MTQYGLVRLVRSIVEREQQPLENAHADGVVEARAGEYASVILGANTTSTPGFFVPPGIDAQSGDHVFVYRRGGYQLIMSVLNRDAIVRDEPLEFNVKDFGAKGDGVNDDTAAIQAAVNAARGAAAYLDSGGARLVFPGGLYLVSAPIIIEPLAGRNHVVLNIEGRGAVSIWWTGGSTSSVFHAYGWKYSTISNIGVVIGASGVAVSDVTAWDMDTRADATSTSVDTFTNCLVTFSTLATSCRAWLLGRDTAERDVSFLNFVNCQVAASDTAHLNAGWVLDHPNVLNCNWFGGYGLRLAPMYSEVGPGASISGGGAMFFYGFGTSENAVDFCTQQGSGAITIIGGWFETGKRFLDHTGTYPGSSPSGHAVSLIGVNIAAYSPADGIIFAFNTSCNVVFDNVRIIDTIGTGYTAAMVQLGGPTTGRGSFVVRGGAIRAADPFWTIEAGRDWAVRIEDVALIADIYSQLLARFTPRDPDRKTGTASIVNGGTIAHGLGRTPSAVGVTPAVAKRIASVTALDGTNLTVSLHDDTGAAIAVAENVRWWVA